MTSTVRRPSQRITVIRMVDKQWVVIRRGRQVYSNKVRTACEQWAIRNPA